MRVAGLGESHEILRLCCFSSVPGFLKMEIDIHIVSTDGSFILIPQLQLHDENTTYCVGQIPAGTNDYCYNTIV